MQVDNEVGVVRKFVSLLLVGRAAAGAAVEAARQPSEDNLQEFVRALLVGGSKRSC